jgi:hypothetical protein
MPTNSLAVCFVHEEFYQPSTRWFLYPARHLESASSCTFTELERGQEPDAAVYVVERALWRVPFERLHSKRKRIFGWLDDAVWQMPLQSPQAELWRGRWPDYIQLLAKVAGMICPSRLLAEDIGQLTTTPVHYIPNYHDFPVVAAGVHDRGVVGWGGSYLHWISWRDSGAYKLIPPDLTVEIIDHYIVAQMIKPFNKVKLLPTLAFADYLRHVVNWDAYVIPLAGDYDLRRSWIKVLEAAYCGTPVMAFGMLGPYADCPLAAFVGTGQEWAEAQRITQHLDEWKGVLFDG